MSYPNTISSSPSQALTVHRPRGTPKSREHLVKIRAILLRQSSIAQKADYRFWRQPTVIFLVGSSSAGKSTIINAIKNIQGQQRVDLSIDLFCMNLVYDFLRDNHHKWVVPDDWDHLHRVLVGGEAHIGIHDALEGTFTFNAGVTADDRKRAKRIAKTLVRPVETFLRAGIFSAPGSMEAAQLDAMLATARKGEDVVADLVDFPAPLLIGQSFVRSIFVYCPLRALVDHVADRNQKALRGETSKIEVRDGSFPLEQYAELLRPKTVDDSPADVIERLSRQDIENAFERNFSNCIEVRRQLRPSLLAEQEASGDLQRASGLERERLLRAFGFAPTDPLDRTIEYVQRVRLDGRINTADPALGATPAQRGRTSAENILRFLMTC